MANPNRSFENLIYYSYATQRDLKKYNALSEWFWSNVKDPQKLSVQKYSNESGAYSSINRILRNFVPADQPIPLKSPRGATAYANHVITMAKNVEEAFQYAVTLPEGTWLFRGTRLKNGSPLPRIGQVIVDPGFSSTSLDPEIATDFASYGLTDSDHLRIFYAIRIGKNGAKGLFLGNTKETEILLSRGLKLKVKEKHKMDRMNIFILESR